MLDKPYIRSLEERQPTDNRSIEKYKAIKGEIETKCKEAKETWLNLKFMEIEQTINIDSAALHKKICEISGRKT